MLDKLFVLLLHLLDYFRRGELLWGRRKGGVAVELEDLVFGVSECTYRRRHDELDFGIGRDRRLTVGGNLVTHCKLPHPLVFLRRDKVAVSV
jgi:hypothetical protein